jgi:hypothetical protein
MTRNLDLDAPSASRTKTGISCLSQKQKFGLFFASESVTQNHMIVHSRKELAYFETGISVIKKIKLIIMTGTGERFLFSKT